MCGKRLEGASKVSRKCWKVLERCLKVSVTGQLGTGQFRAGQFGAGNLDRSKWDRSSRSSWNKSGQDRSS